MASAIKHRMTRRLFDWDYCQRAIYMITVTLADRTQEWLGSLAENGEAQNHAENGEARNHAENGAARNHAGPVLGRSRPSICSRPSRWCIIPSNFGLAVLEALAEMPRHCPEIEILAVQLMPDHIHFIVFAKAQIPRPIGALIRGFKAGAAKRWRSLAENGEARNLAENGEARNHAENGAAQNHAGSVLGRSRPSNRSRPSIPLWAEGFNDVILFREGQLEAMIAYLHDNPRRLAEKRANPSLFRRVTQLKLPLDGGRIVGCFEALGNRHLLERPLHQVQCSRSFFSYKRIAKPGGGLKIARDAAGEPIVERETSAYRERLDAALEAAAHGVVILSPCISDGERQIAREVMNRGSPLVTLQNKGFARLQKPSGRHFNACAEGRLLMMAPAAWPYSPQEKPMTRFDATALNRIAQWLAGEDAVEINYHGMRPNNIDNLAMDAVMAKGGDIA